MDGKSKDIKNEQIEKIKQLFPEAVSEGKVDWEKLKLTLGEDITIRDERYVLNWAGKSEAFRVLQQPTTATLAPAPKESVNFNKTENIFIEGENLEVLKALQKSYHNKIKMIYIDPPYNTGNDSFIYPDRFKENKEEYLKKIGEKDEEGYLMKEGLFRKNSKENGQFHSVWLSMMYPRLFLARNLLRDDGVIFISIDDNEVHNLRMVMNEIFGEENFVGVTCWRKKAGAGADSKLFFRQHEYILIYGKNLSEIYELYQPLTEEQIKEYKNPDNDKRGEWAPTDLSAPAHDNDPKRIFEVTSPSGKIFKDCWSYTKENFDNLLKEDLIWFGKNGDQKPKRKRFLKDKKGLTPRSWIDDILTADGKKDMEKLGLVKIFEYPKPTKLLKRILQIASNKDDIIMDFFAGSSPLAQAVLDLNVEDSGNRKFICAQLPEKCGEDTEAYKVGYKTIADIGKERIRRVIKKIKQEAKENKDLFSKDKPEPDLGFKVFKLKESNFKIWRSNVIENGEDLDKQMKMFQEPAKTGAEMTNMMWELLLKNGYELTAKVEEKEISKCPVYAVEDGELVICLAKLNETAVKGIVKMNPKRVICLDSLFDKNDKLKTNTALQFKDAGVEFKTI